MTDDTHTELSDRELGMNRIIPRRDFLNGAAMTIGGAVLPQSTNGHKTSADEAQNGSGYNPPISTGLRGSHPGSFEMLIACVTELFGKKLQVLNCSMKNTT